MKKFVWLAIIVGWITGAASWAQVTITNVYVSASTGTTATIVWTTSGPATSQILYGYNQGTYLPYSSPINRTMVTSHSVTLTVLNTTTMYSFAAVSVDAANHTTQSSISLFSLCGAPMVPLNATANNYYQYGSYALTWVPPTGSSGTPTVCGGTMQTSISGSLSGGASFSASVADASKVIPGPGTWHIAVTDAGNLAPVSFNSFITFANQDVSTQLQAATSASGLTNVLANTNANDCYPSFACSGGVTSVSASGGLTVTNPTTTPNIAPDSTHLIPTNTGSSTTFLNGAGTYTTPAGGLTGVTATPPLTETTTSGVANLASTGASGTYPLSGVAVVLNGIVQSIGAPFTATLACSTNAVCSNVQVGNASTSPANFIVGYANPSTATSSSLQDSYYSAAVTCSFTTGATCQLQHQYCLVGQGIVTITYTLTATGASQTSAPTQQTNCSYLTFAGGAGTASGPPTAATANAPTTVSLTGSGTTTINAWGYAQETGSFTFTSLSSQYACFVLHGASHTFTYLGSTVLFSSTSLGSWPNYYSFSQAMYLYCSPTYYTTSSITFGVS